MVGILLAPSLWAAGARESQAKGPIEVTFWSLFTGGDGEFFDAMVDEFNRTHTDIVAKTDTVKFDNYYTKLTTALSANNAPDVVVVHQSNLLGYVPRGVFMPLDDLLAKNNAPLDDFVAAPLDAVKYDGKTYALPVDVPALIMYYNLDRLMYALFFMSDMNGDGLKAWMDEWVYGCENRAAYIDHYVQKFGSKNLDGIRCKPYYSAPANYGSAFTSRWDKDGRERAIGMTLAEFEQT